MQESKKKTYRIIELLQSIAKIFCIGVNFKARTEILDAKVHSLVKMYMREGSRLCICHFISAFNCYAHINTHTQNCLGTATPNFNH